MSVINDVLRERERQQALKAAGKFNYTCADVEMSNPMRLAVLMEEVGEVATEVLHEGGDEPGFVDPVLARASMRKELIQVAAVCVAWVEGLDAGVMEKGEEPGFGYVCEPMRRRAAGCTVCGEPVAVGCSVHAACVEH